jgi:hypothetical protein
VTRRRFLIVVVILLVPVAMHAIWDQVEANRFARYVDELRAHGEPVDLRDQQRPLETDEERQASRIYYAAAILAADGLPPPKTSATGGIPNPRAVVADAEQRLAEAGPPSAVDARLIQLQQMLAASDAAFDLLDRATRLRFERFSPERAAYSYQTNDLLQLAGLNALRTDLRSFTGDGRGAAAALYAGVRLQRTLRRVLAPGTFGSLRLMLDRTAPETTALSRLQEAYAASADDDGLARDTTEFRARMIGAVWPTTARPFFAQRLGSRGGSQDWSSDSLRFVVLRPWITHRFLWSLREIGAAIAIARKPWPYTLRTEKSLAPSGPADKPSWSDQFLMGVMMHNGILVWRRPVAEILGPAMTRAGRTLAQGRVAVAVLAMERWRLAHNGAVAPDLQTLVPGVLTAVPLDPFTGQPLRFIRSSDSYTIYSPGEDRAGNGGDIGEWVPDVRGGYPRGKGRDIGIRVPLHPLH